MCIVQVGRGLKWTWTWTRTRTVRPPPSRLRTPPPCDQPLEEAPVVRLLRDWVKKPSVSKSKRLQVLAFLDRQVPYATSHAPLKTGESVVFATLSTDRVRLELRTALSVGIPGQTTLYWSRQDNCDPLHCHNMRHSLTLRRGPSRRNPSVPLELDSHSLNKAMNEWPVREPRKLCHNDCERRGGALCELHTNRGKPKPVQRERSEGDVASESDSVKRCIALLSVEEGNNPKQVKRMDSEVTSHLTGSDRDSKEEGDGDSAGGRNGRPSQNGSTSEKPTSSSSRSSVADNSSSWSGLTDASTYYRRQSQFHSLALGHHRVPRPATNDDYVLSNPAVPKMLDIQKLLGGALQAVDVESCVQTPSFESGPVWTCRNCKMVEVDAHDPSIESLESLCEDPKHTGVIAHMSTLAFTVPRPAESTPPPAMRLWEALGVDSEEKMSFQAGKGNKKPAQLPIGRGIREERTLLDTEIPANAFATHQNPRQSFVEYVAAHYPPWVVGFLPGHSPRDQIRRWAHYTGNCANRDTEQCCWLHCQWMSLANPGTALGLHWDMLALQAVLGDASTAINEPDARAFVVDQLRLHQLRDSHKGMFTDRDYSTWDKSNLAYTRYRQYTVREHYNLQGGDGSFVKGWFDYDPKAMARSEDKTAHPDINHMVFTEVDAVNLVCEGKPKLLAILWVDYTPRSQPPTSVPSSSVPLIFPPNPSPAHTVRSVGQGNRTSGGFSGIASRTARVTRVRCMLSIYWQVSPHRQFPGREGLSSLSTTTHY
jgi:hypothetical protein